MRLSFDRLPTASTLFLDYLHHWSRVEGFYGRPYGLDDIERFARQPAYPGRSGEALGAVLERQQERWRNDPGPASRLRNGAFAVMTGQQAGLFTGPMFSILKGLTAVKIAGALRGRGIDAVPVFWMAAEDHDREEIRSAGILDADSGFHKITAELSGPDNAPAGWLRFDAGICAVIDTCFDCLPQSPYRNEVRALLESVYQPNVSPVEAFARMMARLFRDTGLILVDPLEPEFRGLAEVVMGSAVERIDTIRSAVFERDRQLRAAGYALQVRVDDAFTGFFTYRNHSRQPLRLGESAPGSSLSPNALLRPWVQDSLFPTVATVAGPAEIAYLAQAGAVYRCLETPMPPIVPRIAATLVEPRVARVMKKYRFQMEDVFGGRSRLREIAVGRIHDTRAFEHARSSVADAMERVRPHLDGVDPTLSGALDTALKKMRYQVDRLERRLVTAETRRNQILEDQIRGVANGLFPDGKLQERATNVTSFLVRYGLDLVALLDARLQLDPASHQVVEL